MANNPKKPPTAGAPPARPPEPVFPVAPEPALPRQTAAAETVVMVTSTSKDAVFLKLLPAPDAVAAILTETFGGFGWCCRRYACNGTLYCAVGVYNPLVGDYTYKDAPARTRDSTGKTRAAEWADATSLINAAALWDVCKDVLQLPTIRLGAEQVDIIPVAGRDGKTITGYQLNQHLVVDKFSRDANGAIQMVQFTDRSGKKIVWPGP